MGLLLNLFLVATGVLVGFLWFYWLVSNQVKEWFHLPKLGDRFRFFLSPYPPNNMVVLVGLSGEARVYVDAEIKSTERGYTINTPEGVIYTPVLKPKLLSILESAIVPRVYTPYALGWRALSGWMVGFLWGYYGIILATPEITLSIDFIVPLILLFNYVVYLMGNVLNKLTTPNMETHVLTANAINPPTIKALPAVGPLGLSPVEAAKLRKEKIEVKVDKEAVKALEEIRETLGVDSHAAAELLTSAHLLRLYRQKIGSMLARVAPLIEAERVVSKVELLRLAVPKLVVVIIIFVLGLIVGWALGGGDIVFAPAAP